MSDPLASRTSLPERVVALLRALAARSRGAGRDGAVLVASGVAVAILGYVWVLSAGRLLSLRQYADFTAAASIIYFLAIATAPVSQTIAFFTTVSSRDGVAPGNTIRHLERWVLGVGAALIALSLVGSLLLGRLGGAWPPALILMIPSSAVALALVSIRRGYIQGNARFDAFAVNITIEAIVRLGALFLACRLLPTAAVALATYAAASFVSLALLPRAPAEGPRAVRSVLAWFGPALLTMVVYSAFLNLDVVLVRRFFAPAHAALYGAASFLGRGVGMLVLPLYFYAIPTLASVAGDRREVKRRFVAICAAFVALEAIAVGAIALLRRPLVAVLLPPGYGEGAGLIVPIAGMVAVGGLAFLVCQLPSSTGDFRFLPLYVAALAAEVVAVAMWHDTLLRAVAAMFGAQLLALALLGGYVAWSFRRRREEPG